jgi:hypothetical protein
MHYIECFLQPQGIVYSWRLQSRRSRKLLTLKGIPFCGSEQSWQDFLTSPVEERTAPLDFSHRASQKTYII